MRLLVLSLLLSTALAGCFAAEEEEPDPLLGYCPEWSTGPEQDDLHLEITPENQTILQIGPDKDGNQSLRGMHNGHPLDRFHIRIINWSGEQVELRAIADDRSRPIRDLQADQGNQWVPVARIQADGDYLVDLASIEDTPHPTWLTLNLQGEGAFDMQVQYFYRVCGARL